MSPLDEPTDEPTDELTDEPTDELLVQDFVVALPLWFLVEAVSEPPTFGTNLFHVRSATFGSNVSSSVKSLSIPFLRKSSRISSETRTQYVSIDIEELVQVC